MTPALKAIALVNKFREFSFCEWDDVRGFDTQSGVSNAKECAKVSVLDTIEGIKQIIGDQDYMWSEHQKDIVKFYETVLVEIDNLPMP